MALLAQVRQYAEDFPSALAPAVQLAPPASPAAAAAGDQSVVLVTGGGTGIGRAVALRLAQGGWQGAARGVVLVLTGRRAAPLEEAAAAARAAGAAEVLAWPCDLTSEQEVGALFAAIERRRRPPSDLP